MDSCDFERRDMREDVIGLTNKFYRSHGQPAGKIPSLNALLDMLREDGYYISRICEDKDRMWAVLLCKGLRRTAVFNIPNLTYAILLAWEQMEKALEYERLEADSKSGEKSTEEYLAAVDKFEKDSRESMSKDTKPVKEGEG